MAFKNFISKLKPKSKSSQPPKPHPKDYDDKLDHTPKTELVRFPAYDELLSSFVDPAYGHEYHEQTVTIPSRLEQKIIEFNATYQPITFVTEPVQIVARQPDGVDYGPFSTWARGREFRYFPTPRLGQIIPPSYTFVHSLTDDSRCQVTGVGLELDSDKKRYTFDELTAKQGKPIPGALHNQLFCETPSDQSLLGFRWGSAGALNDIAPGDPDIVSAGLCGLGESYEPTYTFKPKDVAIVVPVTCNTWRELPYIGRTFKESINYITGQQLIGPSVTTATEFLVKYGGNHGTNETGQVGTWFEVLVPPHLFESLPIQGPNGRWYPPKKRSYLARRTIRIFIDQAHLSAAHYRPFTFQVPAWPDFLVRPGPQLPLIVHEPGVWCRYWPVPGLKQLVYKKFWGNVSTIDVKERVELVSVKQPGELYSDGSLIPLFNDPTQFQRVDEPVPPNMDIAPRPPSYTDIGIQGHDSRGRPGVWFEIHFPPYLKSYANPRIQWVYYPSQLVPIYPEPQRTFVPNTVATEYQPLVIRPKPVKVALRGVFGRRERPVNTATRAKIDSRPDVVTTTDDAVDYEYYYRPLDHQVVSDPNCQTILGRPWFKRTVKMTGQGRDTFNSTEYREGIVEEIFERKFHWYRVEFPAYEIEIDHHYNSDQGTNYPHQRLTIQPSPVLVDVPRTQAYRPVNVTPELVTVQVFTDNSWTKVDDISIEPDEFIFYPPLQSEQELVETAYMVMAMAPTHLRTVRVVKPPVGHYADFDSTIN